MGVKKNKSGKKKGSALFFFILFVGIPFLIVKNCTASPKQISEAVENDLHNEVLAEKISSVTEKINDVTEKIQSSTEKTSAFNSKTNTYELTGPVVDTAAILSKQEYSELDAFLTALDKNTGVQIAVLTVNSLDGEDIESFSMRHAEEWKLGKKGIDNGALLTVALEEHDVRIETGYGTEGALTDAICSRILRNVIIPEFKNGNYGKGIIEGVKNMAGVITSDSSLVSDSMPSDSSSADSVSDTGALAVFIILFILTISLSILSKIGRKLFPNSRLLRFLFMTRVLTGSSGGHSGSSSYSSHSSSGFSGGFSGGGGSFGGGGASGHW